MRGQAAAALKRIAESKEPPTPPADPQTAKVFITADPVAAVKKALPEGWVLDSHCRSGGSGYKIEPRRQTFEKAFRAVLVIPPPNAKQRPEEHGPGKTFTTILKAENGEASLWADAGN